MAREAGAGLVKSRIPSLETVAARRRSAQDVQLYAKRIWGAELAVKDYIARLHELTRMSPSVCKKWWYGEAVAGPAAVRLLEEKSAAVVQRAA